MRVDLSRPGHLIGVIVGVAALLRLPLASVEMFHHPDEIWQYLEPAYGMVAGHQVVTWEYREGMRSWLIPTLLAMPIWFGKIAAPHGALYLLLARLLMVGISLAIVGFGAAIALRISRTHAIVTGLVLATAFELVYFSARTLSDTIAVDLFLPAAFLLLPKDATRGRWFTGGLLLGLCVAVRFQLGPTMALFALLVCGMQARKWGWVVIGGIAGLAIDGLVDLAHGLTPFAWMANNFRLNLVEGKSAGYGTEPAWWFVTNQLKVWGVMGVPMLALAVLGGRRLPILFVVAIANIAIHSLIPHKEYRFIWLSSVLLILLAGIGSADVLLWAFRRWRAHKAIVAGAVLFWLGCSASTALSGKAQWKGGGRSIALMRAEHREAGGCGLAYYRPSRDQRASYYYYDRPTTIAFLDEASAAEDLKAYGGAFNLIVTHPANASALGPAYHQSMCKYGADLPGDATEADRVCLYVRSGGCEGALPARLDVNAGFARQRR